MNKLILMGNLTRDPEVRYTAGEKQIAVCRFCITVNRKSKSKNSNQSNTEVDFINCAAFGKTGENISKFFTKGKRIASKADCKFRHTPRTTRRDIPQMLLWKILISARARGILRAVRNRNAFTRKKTMTTKTCHFKKAVIE